jgi:hypothetical protein
MFAKDSLGHHPWGKNMALNKPQVIKAPIFGMIMELNNRPICCSLTTLFLIDLTFSIFIVTPIRTIEKVS